MSSQLQNGGHLKENDFSAKIHDGFWIFFQGMIQKTLLHSLSFVFFESFHVFMPKY